MSTPIALTIAGSDSGGGAGIQADLKTFQAFHVFGTSAITAITAQNTRGVSGVHAVPADMVSAQIHALAEDLPPAACKTGMLATADVVAVVADALSESALGRPQYVLDPVMVATSGDRLLDRDGEAAIADRLLPLSTIVTPNLKEAAILTGSGTISDLVAMRNAAESLVARGANAALVKGGHLDGDEVVDVLFDGREFMEWSRPRIHTTSTHGTGCTLSAAIAAGLARERPLRQAVEDALDFVHRAMRRAPGIGGGHGPLNHWLSAGYVPAE